MVISYYYKNEQEFKSWIKTNRLGYIYNDFGGANPEYKKVHDANCIWVDKMNTNIKKVCSEDLAELIAWLRKNRGLQGDGYTPCNNCHPI